MKKVYSDEVVKMKIRNILRSLKKLDNHTASEIDKKFPMNPKTDELFEKSYEKYLGENNLQENETTGYVIRKSTNPAVRFARIIVPITACIGIFAVSGKIASVFSNVEKNNESTVENNYTSVSSQYEVTKPSETLEISKTTAPEKTDAEVTTATVLSKETSMTKTEEITAEIILQTVISTEKSEISSPAEPEPQTTTVTISPQVTEETEISSPTEPEPQTTTVTVSPQVTEVPICSVPKVSESIEVIETPEPVLTQPTTATEYTGTFEYTGTLPPSSSVVVSTKPTVTQPVIIPNPVFKKKMYIDSVIELAKKGHELTWADFREYDGTDIGSGIYIMEYKTDIEGYILYVSGVPTILPDGSVNAPDRIRLTYMPENRSIDIRDESVIDFVYPGTPDIDHESKISKVTVTSGTTVELSDEEISHLMSLMKNIRTGREDQSINEYDGQYISVTISYENGNTTEIGVYNPFFVVNGTPYRTLYEPCLELHIFLWEVLNK